MLKIALFLTAILLSSCASIGDLPVSVSQNTFFGIADTKVSDAWAPGNYWGIIPGRSKRADVLRILGEPLTTGKSANDLPAGASPLTYDNYKSDEIAGKLEIISSADDIVDSINIYPDNFSQKNAIERFGTGYRKTAYSFLECPGDAGSSRIRENAEGDLEYFEYRPQGIAIFMDDDGKVQSISYLKGPQSSGTCSDNP